jgi:hypothetical protein
MGLPAAGRELRIQKAVEEINEKPQQMVSVDSIYHF